jgi:hypothetical protein
MAARSTTIYQDSTGFDCNGMLYTCQFRPNVQTFANTALSKLEDRFGKHKGYKELVMADSFEQINIKDKPVTVPSPGNSIQVVSLGKIPTSGGEVLMRSPRSTSSKATEGAFIVHQFSEPTQRYVSMSRTYTRVDDVATQNNTFCYYEWIDATGAWHLSRFQSVDEGNACPDFEWYDMTWAFVLYDFSSSAGSSSAQVAPLVFKTIMCIDVQPVSGSVLQAVVHESPIYDPLALRMASTVRQQMPDSLPSAANDLGSIMTTIAQYAPSVIDWVVKLFSKKKETPSAPVKIAPSAPRKTVSRPSRIPVPIKRAVNVPRPSRIPVRTAPLSAMSNAPARSVNTTLTAQAPRQRVSHKQQAQQMQALPRRNIRRMGPEYYRRYDGPMQYSGPFYA